MTTFSYLVLFTLAVRGCVIYTNQQEKEGILNPVHLGSEGLSSILISIRRKAYG